MFREQIKRVIDGVMASAALRQRESPVPTVVDVAMRCAEGRREIVDVGCGSDPTVGYRLLVGGFRGPVRFVDWRTDAVRVHAEVLRAVAGADGVAVPSSWSWERASVEGLRLEGAVLLIQGTLPRSLKQGALVKPNDAASIATMLTTLRNTRAHVAVIHVTEQLAHPLQEGARIARMPCEAVAPIATAHWTPEPDPTYVTRMISLSRERT